MNIYIAGPFFKKIEIKYIKQLIRKVKRLHPNDNIFIPMEHFIPDGVNIPNDQWAKKVFQMDVDALKHSDKVYALYLGHYSDSGTAWELGFAYAMNIPVELYIPKNVEHRDFSLMVINSACNDKSIFINDVDFLQK